MAYPPPIAPSTAHVTSVAGEKTCLTAAAPFRAVTTAPTISVATMTPCQNGVIGRLLMAWAMKGGTSDRVQANTIPDPSAASSRLGILTALYALGSKY